MIYLKDLGMKYPTEKSKLKSRYALYMCPSCGKEVERPVRSVLKSKTGVCKSCSNTIGKTTHGQSKTRLYRIWNNMKTRCYSKDAINFKDYGGKGVKVCDEWLNDFMSFNTWCGNNGYSEELTIDRIDSNGDYTPSNCRWVGALIQGRNTTELQRNNKTGYRGVSKKVNSNKYTAQIGVDGKVIFIGYFTTAKEAAIAYNQYVIDNCLEHTINKGL